MGTRSQTSFGSTLLGLLVRAAGFSGAWQRRREIGRLGALDDRMLADIGVTRQDLASAMAQRLFIDASEILAERARETQRGKRASALEAIRAGRDFRRDGRWAA